MAKESMKAREVKRAKLAKKYAAKRAALKQIIFPEINIDNIMRLTGMNITFVTTAKTDEEGYALLKEFGLPFKNAKNS